MPGARSTARDRRDRYRRRRDEDRRRSRRRRDRSGRGAPPAADEARARRARRCSPTAPRSPASSARVSFRSESACASSSTSKVGPRAPTRSTGAASTSRPRSGSPRVTLESDVRAAARAEALFGAGAGRSPFLFAIVGTGASVCLVIDGHPYAGAHGHAIVLGAPPVEAVASGRAPRAAPAASSTPRRFSPIRPTPPLVDGAASALGQALAVLANALDPSLIVLGGGLGAEPAFRARVEAACRALLAYPSTPELEVVGSQLGSGRWRHRRSRMRARGRTIGFAAVLDETGLWLDLAELPSSLAADARRARRRGGGRLVAGLAGRPPDRGQRQRRRVLRRRGAVARLTRGRGRPRGACRAQRPARARRLRVATRGRVARRLVVGGVPRSHRGRRRRRTFALRGRDVDRGLNPRLARGRPGARQRAAPAGGHPHAGVLRRRRDGAGDLGRAHVRRRSRRGAATRARTRSPTRSSPRGGGPTRSASWTPPPRSPSGAAPPGRRRSRPRCCSRRSPGSRRRASRRARVPPRR